MTDSSDTNECTPSTRWEWKRVKMRPSPEGPQGQRSQSTSKALSRRSKRESLTITVKNRGGPEDWWEIRARGRVWRRPGYTALSDLLGQVYDGEGSKAR